MSRPPHGPLVGLVSPTARSTRRGELQSLLPRPLVQALDWSTLALVPGESRDVDLVDYHTDLLFSARARDGGQALIYVLLEHQSTPEPDLAFRLLRYMVRIWESWRDEHGPAPPRPLIVPLVFYHGDPPWSVPLSFESTVAVPSGLDEVVRPYVPSFRYVVDNDLSQVPDDELRPWVDDWRDVMRPPEAADDVRPLVRYVYTVKGAEEVRAFLGFLEREVGPEAKQIMKTYGEELIEQGMHEGEVAGERKVLLK